MRWAAQKVVLAKRIADLLLGTLSARPAGALLTAPKLHLSKDAAFAVIPTSSSVTLALQEADFSGYAAGGVAVVFVGPVNMGSQADGLIMDNVFLRTLGTPDIGESVYGWWIDDAAGFVCGEAFGQPLALDLVEDFLDLLIAVPINLYPPFVNG